MCIFTLQLSIKIFPQEFTLPPSALALTAASCLLKRGQARKQCVPPRNSHSTHLTTHFVGVYTLSIKNSYFLFSLLQITVLLQHICFRTFRVQVNVKTTCDACAVAGYALCWYAAADSNSAEHCKLCTETTATYCNQRAACAMHLAGCRPTIYLPGTAWYQPTPNLECRHI